ncbi:class F sortase [Nocardioides dongkuii]|uniref:class F sortase n=1 Tax=Nocardioides dongkuii TaxID=2760089 RepID=UPI001C70ADF3|nr:class F sortase [Nocardioides dongkuii]
MSVGVAGRGDGHAISATPGSTSSPALPATDPQVAGERVPRGVRAPVRLAIPAIGVSTPLVGLGLEEDRTVEVPEDADRAGWFELGPPPGVTGSSVILGHVDSAAGPAVFARLEDLERGDVVEVGRADGSEVAFEVLRLELYPNAEFPAQRVYAASGARRLNLVTCAGDYDAGRGGYQSNLVVYTRQVART